MEIQKLEVKLPTNTKRVETGPVQFIYPTGEIDWTGFFLRGDNAFALRLAIANVLVNYQDPLARMQLQGFMIALDECNLNRKLVKEMQKTNGPDKV